MTLRGHFWTVAPHLARLRTPALLVAAEAEPIVPPATLRPSLAADHANLTVQWVPRPGHVGFPQGVDFGFPACPGHKRRILAWMQAQL